MDAPYGVMGNYCLQLEHAKKVFYCMVVKWDIEMIIDIRLSKATYAYPVTANQNFTPSCFKKYGSIPTATQYWILYLPVHLKKDSSFVLWDKFVS